MSGLHTNMTSDSTKEKDIKEDGTSANTKTNNDNNDPSDEVLMKRYEERVGAFEKKADYPRSTNSIFRDKLKPFTVSDMKSVYPFCHGAVLLLALNMIEFKRRFGSRIEKEVYFAQDKSKFTIVDFMDRIATKRAIYFLNPGDSHCLRNGFGGLCYFVFFLCVCVCVLLALFCL